jgi:hypothetical protein
MTRIECVDEYGVCQRFIDDYITGKGKSLSNVSDFHFDLRDTLPSEVSDQVKYPTVE